MQQQAIERIREMERRAKPGRDKNFEVPPMPSFVNTPYSKNERDAMQKSTPSWAAMNMSDKKTGFNLLKLLDFKSIRPDGDISVILVLLLLLSSDGGDELLLLALLYIML